MKEIPSSMEEMTRTLREKRLYVGEGGIDIASIVNRIPEIPYSIELPNIKRVKEYGFEEHARRCLESAKNYFDLHQRDERNHIFV
jgi:sugar phosphate isomerase/epimerase